MSEKDPVPDGLSPCDLCGSTESRFLHEVPSAGAPLVRCEGCGLRYLGLKEPSLAFREGSAAETVVRIQAANAPFAPLELTEQRRLDRLNARWRLARIRGHLPKGRLLEVGCARGDFLEVARPYFDVHGIEPNRDLAAEARSAAPVFEGLLEEASWSDFDGAATFHVIEHVASPTAFVREIRRRLKPGGLLVVETPNVASLPYRLLKQRWRQFIPEHLYFFDPATLRRLLEDNGFEMVELASIGKYASVELLLNRLSRSPRLTGGALRLARVCRRIRLNRLTVRINPLDIMIAFARRRASG